MRTLAADARVAYDSAVSVRVFFARRLRKRGPRRRQQAGVCMNSATDHLADGWEDGRGMARLDLSGACVRLLPVYPLVLLIGGTAGAVRWHDRTTRDGSCCLRCWPMSMRGMPVRPRLARPATSTSAPGRGCSTSAHGSRLRRRSVCRSKQPACIRRSTGPTGITPIAGTAAGCGMCARTACDAVSFPITRRRFALRNTTGDVRIGRRPQPPGAL